MIKITGPQDYIEYLHGLVVDDDVLVVRDTMESICETIVIPQRADNLYFGENGYCAIVWNVIHDYMNDWAPQASALDTLKYYQQNGLGWFDPQTAFDYAQAFKQLADCVGKLIHDPSSRQATIRLPGTSCLTSVQFLLRSDDILITSATFRSVDLVKGLPVDVYVLQRLTDQLINRLHYTKKFSQILSVYAGSSHIYLKDVPRVETAWEDNQVDVTF